MTRSSSAVTPLPLAGLRVLDLTHMLAGPYCTWLLGSLGADVVKVEVPGRGDFTRTVAPFHDGQSVYFLSVNRSKRSLTLNLKDPRGAALFRRLAERADVLVENNRAGVMDRLGLGPDALAAVNPRLVYVRGSGFGAHGPDANEAGYDGTAFVSRGSFAHQVTPAGSDWPVLASGVAGIGDLPGSMMLVGGIAAALLQRERTGVAPIVDVSLLATAMWQMAPGLVATGMFDMEEVPKPSREISAARSARSTMRP